MSIYNEFKRNPWNFLFRKLKVSVNEKELEQQILAGTSDMNFRNILLYQNNGLSPYNDHLNYETLLDGDGITTIMYLFEADTYIIDIPRDIEASCIHTLAIINRAYSQWDTIQIDNSCYGPNDIYSLVSRHFKLVYNCMDSTVYLEGSPSSSFWFFKKIKCFRCKASIRIYSTGLGIFAKDSVSPDDQMPTITSIDNNSYQMYPYLSLPIRTIEGISYGLDYLNQFFNCDSSQAYKMLMKTPVYKTGISIGDMTRIKQIISSFKIGTLIDRNYETNVSSYESRLSTYGFIAYLKDAVVGLFFNTNSKMPFFHSTGHRESIFFYLNHYCYFIGKTPISFDYSFSEFTVKLYEKNIMESTSVLTIKNDEYKLMGDWKITCGEPLTFSDSTKGNCTCEYYSNVNPVCTLVEL